MYSTSNISISDFKNTAYVLITSVDFIVCIVSNKSDELVVKFNINTFMFSLRLSLPWQFLSSCSGLNTVVPYKDMSLIYFKNKTIETNMLIV